jgi:signal transduction histidine kinase
VLGALALALLLAIAGGLAVSRNLLGRVEGMNETIRRILAGRRGERVVLAGSGDEFDSLAAQFNRLLDENDRLVAKMRSVTNDIAHDLRTPLARMRGHIESALASNGDVETSQRALGSLLVETNAVLDTFNALLQIAQIESRAIREQMEPVDLEPVVQGAVDLYQPVADESGIELVPDAGSGLLVNGNRHLIAQALSNLLDNAVKYAPGPGRVEIRTRRRDGRIELSVGDRGPGIPEAERAHVLERGVRLDASRHLRGTGLGLSFVAAVADLHDAKLSLEDHGPGLLVTLAFPA